jgi:hypothetical protein
MVTVSPRIHRQSSRRRLYQIQYCTVQSLRSAELSILRACLVSRTARALGSGEIQIRRSCTIVWCSVVVGGGSNGGGSKYSSKKVLQVSRSPEYPLYQPPIASLPIRAWVRGNWLTELDLPSTRQCSPVTIVESRLFWTCPFGAVYAKYCTVLSYSTRNPRISLLP